MKRLLTNLPDYIVRVCAVIIALMPFHALLTVWASGVLGHYTLLRLWKEFLLLGLSLGAATVVFLLPQARKTLRREPVIGLIALYVTLVVGIGGVSYIVGSVSLKAYAYGVLLDSRYLVFFAVAWLATHYDDLLVRYWKQLLLVPASIVTAFATLQYSLLPADFLRHFGYGPSTIPPVSTIDQKEAYQRVQSTLRGPNPFGAYLVLVLSALGRMLLGAKGRRIGLYAFYVLAGLALVFTFSRSAWLGALAATAWLVWRSLNSGYLRRVVLIAGGVAIIAFGATGYLLRENDHFQNVFFHTNEHSRSSESSNTGHFTAVRQGVGDILSEPWGRGTGTAGPASVYNEGQPRIAENYFVQVGQEVGVAGLALFVVINSLVAKLLWERRGSTLASILLASFIGITLINLLMHAWADDTLAYIWWGLAGAAIATPVIEKS